MFLYYLINIWKKQNRLNKTLCHFARLAHLRVFIWKIFISPTISHKNLCKNYWDSVIIMKKSWKMFDLLEDSQNHSPWFNVVPSLQNLCWAVEARDEEANLQPTLNKETGGWVSQFLWLIVSKIKKKIDLEIIFWKSGLFLRVHLYSHFY